MVSSEIGHLPENVKVLRKMFCTIDFYMEYSYIRKNREEYNKELVKIKGGADEDIMKKHENYFPISGFSDFSILDCSQRLENAMGYIRSITPALRGLHRYLIDWEKDNSNLLESTILLYKTEVKRIYDKTCT